MSNARPVFAEHDFRKASASKPDRQCVRVARRDGWVELRDDKTTFGAPDDVRLVFTAAQFNAVLAGLRSEDGTGLCLEITRGTDGMYAFRSTVPQPSETDAELRFTEAEVLKFLDGVACGEFDQEITDVALSV
jgi:hypothetical protein